MLTYKNTKRLILAASLLTAAAVVSTAAFAGNRAGAFYGTLSEGYYHFSQQRHLENTAVPGIALGYDFTDQFAAQAGALVLNADHRGHEAVGGAHGFIYQLDGVYRFAKSGNFEPYALGGVQVTSLKPAGNNTVDQAGVNLGIGAQYFVADSIALGAEARDFYTFSGGKNEAMLAANITFLIGGETAAAPTLAPMPTPVPVSLKDEHPNYKGE